ncbi:MAG: HD domain-containing protein [Pseudoramibacter sp.]
MNRKLTEVIQAAVEIDAGDPKRIQHFLKVQSFADYIASRESLPAETSFLLEVAAILHDIGIHACEEKYHSTAGHYQEIEGPPIARQILDDIGGFTEAQIERVLFLIAHHHTYDPKQIDGLDYQILIEADFLVNLYEDQAPESAIVNAKNKIFKTNTGLSLIEQMFLSKSR